MDLTTTVHTSNAAPTSQVAIFLELEQALPQWKSASVDVSTLLRVSVGIGSLALRTAISSRRLVRLVRTVVSTGSSSLLVKVALLLVVSHLLVRQYLALSR
jgi:hypothetical protein